MMNPQKLRVEGDLDIYLSLTEADQVVHSKERYAARAPNSVTAVPLLVGRVFKIPPNRQS